MPDVLIRNVPQDVLDALERRAAQHGRSLEAELLELMERSTLLLPLRIPDEATRMAAFQAAEAIAEKFAADGRVFGDSVIDLREDRER